MRQRYFYSKGRNGVSKTTSVAPREAAALIFPWWIWRRRWLAISIFSLLATAMIFTMGQVAAQMPTDETAQPLAPASSVAPQQELADIPSGVLPPTDNPDLSVLEINASMVPEEGEASPFKPVRLVVTIANTGSTPLGGLTIKIDPDPALAFVGDVRGFDFTYEQNPSKKAVWKNVSIQPNQVVTLSYLAVIGEIAPGTSPALESKFEVNGTGGGSVVKSAALTATPGVTPSQINQGYVGG